MTAFQQRILAALIIGSLPMMSNALPEVVPLPSPAGPASTRQLVVKPGEFVELCTRLKQGFSVTWTFTADGPLDFNTHFHIADELMYAERMSAMSGARGRLVPGSNQQFCWMWNNPTRGALTIRVRLDP
ncbi:MAG: hypothetical protein HYX43_14510 [Burkholderiales bacterium]|nr:hypothetical protein [Burkholderiales bacterium]